MLAERNDNPYNMADQQRRKSNPTWIHKMISKKHDHGNLTAEQKKQMAKLTSIEYNKSNSTVYCKWALDNPERRVHWDRWFLMFFMGIVIGLLMALMSQLIVLLFRVKMDTTREYLEEDDMWLSWAWNAGIGVAMCVPASILTLYVHPPAVGSGIPQVIAFLNGIMIDGTMSLKNIVVKFMAVVLSVSSGLPCAVYGPVVAIGAAVGKGIGQFESKTLGCTSTMFNRFRNPQDRRAFTTAGIAAGLAAAFNAPMGGLFFAMEESASQWSREMQWQTLFCAGVAASTANLINQAFSGFEFQGYFGLFTLEIVEALDINGLIFVPAIVLGVVCGIFGAMYARIFALLAGIRKRMYSCFSSVNVENMARILETALITVIMATAVIFLPETLSCTSYNEVLDVKGGDEIRDRCTVIPPFGLESARCDQPDANNTMYNEFLTLVLDHPADTLKKLYSRNTHYFLSQPALWMYFPFMYFGAIWTSQVAASGGIFLQVLTSGALMGRSLGLLMLNILKNTSENEIPTGDYWVWLDPGVIAILGAGAMMGGVTRFPLATTLILVEMTRDIHLTVPLLIAVSIAKQVADLLSKHFYKHIMEAKCYPYLEQHLKVAAQGTLIDTELYKACDVMQHPVHLVNTVMSIGELAKMLVNTEHAAYPVVRYNEEFRCDRHVGIITRNELLIILCQDSVFTVQEGQTLIPIVPYPEVSVEHVEDKSAKLERVGSYARDQKYYNTFINLSDYTNTSGSKVDQNFTLKQTYDYFRTLGLRHLTVTDEENAVCGIITRKDLMPSNVLQSLRNITDAPENGAANNGHPGNGYPYTGHPGAYTIDLNNNDSYNDDQFSSHERQVPRNRGLMNNPTISDL